MREINPDLLRISSEADYQAISMSRDEARKLFDIIGEAEDQSLVDLLTSAIDSAQGDCTDGSPRYILLEVRGS